jgi:16S rRNA (guanine527-N7)-methyltransferase
MNTGTEQFARELETCASRYGLELKPETVQLLSTYYEKLSQWNPRLHLVAPCSPQEFARRHVLESLMASTLLSDGAVIVDIGSGGGLPAIPLLLHRPDINATLIEASAKKAVFLQEAIRAIASGKRTQVIARRFQEIDKPFAGYLTCRALENFTQTTDALVKWAEHIPKLLFFGGDSLRESLESLKLSYDSILMPDSERRYLFSIDNA